LIANSKEVGSMAARIEEIAKELVDLPRHQRLVLVERPATAR
jgi:hypothetical protein